VVLLKQESVALPKDPPTFIQGGDSITDSILLPTHLAAAVLQ
jgi:hypothetical protein